VTSLRAPSAAEPNVAPLAIGSTVIFTVLKQCSEGGTDLALPCLGDPVDSSKELEITLIALPKALNLARMTEDVASLSEFTSIRRTRGGQGGLADKVLA
jgi:hypothetical protein